MVATTETVPGSSAPILVVGAKIRPLRDTYHALLRASWPRALGILTLVYLAINLVFATIYFATGGIAEARAGSFADAFFFSVQTLATVGYGHMHPESFAANVTVTVEAVVGTISTAILTGLVFAKFAAVGARIVFSEHVVIYPRDGVPTLMFRIGNDRRDSVMDAKVRATLTRTTRTQEGEIFYRMVDLKLARSVAPVLSRSFVLMHAIDADSPLAGMTAADFAEQEVELLVSVSGLDETTRGPVFAAHNYTDARIRWDHRFVDVLSTRADGRIVIDVRRFHEIEPVAG